MKLVLISQDKKSIWDYSQAMLCIHDLDIVIRPYQDSQGYLIGTYSTAERTQKIFDEIINVFSKSKLILKPKTMLRLDNIEAAKKYYEKLNNEKLVTVGNDFEIVPLGNDYTITYQLPGDKEHGKNKR